ncbi:hypothetical protein ACSQ6I_06000 [Anabaena sp. WFMT]|uniref:hypothetical protein n=1 Tax=Anabaena sp. WFMT TaxID=3449730 RepID=UPI003F25A5ED
MTTPPVDRLDRIEAILEVTVNSLNGLTTRVDDLTYKVDDFIGTANTVLARSAVLDDIIVRLDRNFEESQRNFGENQKSTNAALERLEAILLKLMDK